MLAAVLAMDLHYMSDFNPAWPWRGGAHSNAAPSQGSVPVSAAVGRNDFGFGGSPLVLLSSSSASEKLATVDLLLRNLFHCCADHLARDPQKSNFNSSLNKSEPTTCLHVSLVFPSPFRSVLLLYHLTFSPRPRTLAGGSLRRQRSWTRGKSGRHPRMAVFSDRTRTLSLANQTLGSRLRASSPRTQTSESLAASL